MRLTFALRALLVASLVELASAYALVYVVSLDLAATYPEVAHLRLPFFVALLVGAVPLLLVVHAGFELLGLVDGGEAFSRRSADLLSRVKTLFVLTAGYVAVGAVGVYLALLPAESPTVLFAAITAEAVTLGAVAVFALLQRLCLAAVALRTAQPLTV